MKKIITISFAVSLLINLSFAQIYFIDFENGSDLNNGLTEQTAWKHAPGDENAADNPRNIELIPGSTILFKGGVVYRGSIKMKYSGSESAPIIYKGDGWGSSKAIIDGSEPLTGWRSCISAEEGGVNWQKCYINYAPSGISAFNTRLAENSEFLWLAQEPDQPDPFFFDAVDNFMPVLPENQDSTFLIDSNVFNQADPDYWDGSYILLWVLPNVVNMRAIKEYIPEENKVIFDKTNDPSGYNKYSIYNSIHAIDQPGEYFFDERPELDGTHKIVLYPRDASNIINNQITCYSRPYGIDINDKSNLIIEGFEVRHIAGSGLTHGVGIGTVTLAYKENSGIIIRNNKIYCNAHPTGGYGGIYLSKCNNSIIENNEIFECLKMKGMSCTEDSNLVVSGNKLYKVGGTCLSFYTGKDCRVFNNVISDGHGTHANGMTFYLGCERVLAYNNQVTDFNITLTLQASKDLFFVNNVFNGAENTNYVVACWGAMTGPATFINNTIIGSTSNAALYLSPNAPYAIDSAGDSLTYKMINNILEGGGWSSTNSYQYLRYNNLYTGLAWFQEYPDWSPAEGEIVDWTGTDFQAIPHEEVFENPQEFDYHLIPGSRAMNSGIDPASFFPSEMFPGFDLNADIKGNKRPVGSGWDIGAYEYDGATGVAVEKSVPYQFSLSQNYPNPFNPSTMINYQLPMNNMVTLKIFDILGREIITLVNEQKPAGTYSVQWDGTNSFGQSIGSGVYFYQLKASEGFVETKKMLLIK